MRGKAEITFARILAAGGLTGDAELDILTEALEQAYAQGRQEGFAEGYERGQEDMQQSAAAAAGHVCNGAREEVLAIAVQPASSEEGE